RRRHTRFSRDWSSDVCSSDLYSRSSNRATTAAEPETRSARSIFPLPPRQRSDGLQLPHYPVRSALSEILVALLATVAGLGAAQRSEERRVGEEGSARRRPEWS